METVNRWFYRCTDCLTVAASETELRERWEGHMKLPADVCGICGGSCECMGQVSGLRLIDRRTACACDARCTCAAGPRCDCSCGGVNHGKHVVVEVDVDRGPVPVLKSSGQKASDICREWKAKIAEFEADERWIRLSKMRSGQQWMPQADYDKWYHMYSLFHKARAARSHSCRMKAIERALSN